MDSVSLKAGCKIVVLTNPRGAAAFSTPINLRLSTSVNRGVLAFAMASVASSGSVLLSVKFSREVKHIADSHELSPTRGSSRKPVPAKAVFPCGAKFHGFWFFHRKTSGKCLIYQHVHVRLISTNGRRESWSTSPSERRAERQQG